MRADAARNAGKIVAAATEVWAEIGPDAPLEEIARRAGVGVATVFRRFATKDDLVQACLEHAIETELRPALADAVRDPDSWSAAVAALDAALTMVAGHRTTVAAARDREAVTQRVRQPLTDSIWPVLERAQKAGALRPDIGPDDVPVLVSMVRSTMHPAGGDEWRRYFELLLDALRASRGLARPN
jgi:AcrR family transcriptional regulator